MEFQQKQPELNISVVSPFPKQNQLTSPILQSPLAGAEIKITNAEFVNAVFPNTPKNIFPATCTKAGDPSQGGWPAVRANKTMALLSDNSNNYINCSSFKNDLNGSFYARKGNFAACHFLLLDDLGGKVPLSRLDKFESSWLIETSPGNYQAGIILDNPLTDFDQAEQLLNAIIEKGLCDSGATGPATRWARLPVGINGKPKHKTDSGEPFQCRLIKWAPQVRYTTQEIVNGLSLTLASARTNKLLNKSAPLPLNTAGIMHDGVYVQDTLSPIVFNRKITSKQLSGLLDAIDPDCGYNDWLHVLMAVFHETDGSDDGFELINQWSSKGSKYTGNKEIEVKWKSFRHEPFTPVTVGTLIHMAREVGSDAEAILQNSDDAFELCETVVINPDDRKSDIASRKRHPLGKFSVRDDVRNLEAQMVEQKPLLGDITLLGQASVIYAKPNTGKTLIILFLIIDAIKRGRIDPSKLYYINMDDNSSGLVNKAKLAEEYGFHILADGHLNFKSTEFCKAMQEMVTSDTARGVVVILDTLKKFVDTMSKSQSSDFAKEVRRFCLKGGTVIAMSHTNKNPGTDGKVKFSGTSDIVDDFDCAYTLETISDQNDMEQKIVEFTNIKRRGDVPKSIAYSYSLESGITYNDLLLSVEKVNDDQLLSAKHSTEIKTDATIIKAVEDCIRNGINTKMLLVDASAKQAQCSGRNALKIIEKYTGTNRAIHRWNYVVEGRGAKKFLLLENTTI